MSATWKTKWGPRRVREEPPTLAEALAAAQCLTDDAGQQAEIAAGLMGVDVAEVEAEQKRLLPGRRAPMTLVAATRERGSTRTVVVERRSSRRVQGPVVRSPQRPTLGR